MSEQRPNRVGCDNEGESAVNTRKRKRDDDEDDDDSQNDGSASEDIAQAHDDIEVSNDEEQVGSNNHGKVSANEDQEQIAASNHDQNSANEDQEQIAVNDRAEVSVNTDQEEEVGHRYWLIASPNNTDSSDSFPSAPFYLHPWLLHLIEGGQPVTPTQFLNINNPAYGPADECVICRAPLEPKLVIVKPCLGQPWSKPSDMVVGHALCSHRLHWSCLCSLVTAAQQPGGTPPRCPTCRVDFFHTGDQVPWANRVAAHLPELGSYPGYPHFSFPQGNHTADLRTRALRISLQVCIRIAAYSVAAGYVRDCAMGHIVRCAAHSKEGRNLIAGMVNTIDDGTLTEEHFNMDDLSANMVMYGQIEMVDSGHADHHEDISMAVSELGEEVANRALRLFMYETLWIVEPDVPLVRR